MQGRNKEKGSKPKTISYFLPPELWTENILPRLPVQTLLIFRTVCRSWCSAIDDPAFVSMHHKLSNNNREKNMLLAFKEVGPQRTLTVTLRYRDTLKISGDIFVPHDEFTYETSCNGLFLVMHRGRENLRLCNFSIRKSLILPPCPLAAGYRCVNYLFGFKPSSNDYVVYAFVADETGPFKLLSIAVYTLSDNLWRIRNDKVSLPSWIYPIFLEPKLGGRDVYFGGALHWFGNDRDYRFYSKTHLVSFNFDTEKFSYVELPDTQQGSQTVMHRFLFVLGESLAMLSLSFRCSSVWVLKNNFWNLRMLSLLNSVGFNYINSRLLSISNCFYAEDGDITLVYDNVEYKIMRDEIKHLTMSLSDSVRLEPYVESLVLHKGCEGHNFPRLDVPIEEVDSDSN